jgi:hypothetical protein
MPLVVVVAIAGHETGKGDGLAMITVITADAEAVQRGTDHSA